MSILDLFLDKKEAIIFDLNGTIIVDNQFHMAAFREFFGNKGKVVTDQDYKEYGEGRKNSQIMKRYFPEELSSEVIDQYGEEKESIYRHLYQSHPCVVDGFYQFAEGLKQRGMRIGLATSASRKNIQFIFDLHNFYQFFDCIVSGDDVEKAKPDPDLFLKAAEKLEVHPDKCLVFEDSPVGVEAAKSARMQVIALLTSYTSEQLYQSDLLISDYTELKESAR